MTKKKVCKKCKLFFESEACPICKTTNVSNSWQGRIYVADPEGSMIAKEVEIKIKGEYAIKVR